MQKLPIVLKRGVLISSFEVVDSLSFQDPPHLVSAVSDGTATSNDPADLISQLESCVNVSDYPEARSSLLALLVNHKSALALPGESLRIMDRVTNCITLKPDARPSHFPSYRLPHSQ